MQAVSGSSLEGLMPHNFDDPLRALCERIALPDILSESLLTGHSKCARFYRWAKKRRKINYNSDYICNYNHFCNLCHSLDICELFLALIQ